MKGEGNQQDYGMRIYDGRLGRFLSVDPITAKYPMLTPYQFASNSPIQGIDLDGLELLKINSSAYRMKYLLSYPLLKKETVTSVEVNTVETIENNLPNGYTRIPDLLVAAHGHDVYVPPAPVFNSSPNAPYIGDDDGGSVQQTPEISSRKVPRILQNRAAELVIGEKDPAKFNKVGAITTSPQDVYTLGRIVFDGVTSFNQTLISMDEQKLRQNFYYATAIVDNGLSLKENAEYIKTISKITEVGVFRADLINYITDGTQPSQFKGAEKDKSYYNSEVLRIGDQIMKDNKIKKQDKPN